MHLSKIDKGILCMKNCHQNKKNGQAGHKMVLNSQNSIFLTILLVLSNITFLTLRTMWILYLSGVLAQLYGALLERSKVTRTLKMSCIEFKSGIYLPEKIEICEFILIGVKWFLLG